MKSRLSAAMTLFWLLICLMAPARVQAEIQHTPSGYRAWVVVSSTPKELEGTSMLLTDNEAQPLPQNKRAAIGPINITESASIQIFSDKSEKPLLDVQLPSSKMTLIVLIPVVTKDKGLSFEIITKDLAEFDAGNWLVVNRAESELRVKLGDEQSIITKGANQIMKGAKDSTSPNASISFESRNDEAKDWALLSSSRVAVHSTRREIVFFSNDSPRKGITYHGVTLSIND